jgi:hypothetical protein
LFVGRNERLNQNKANGDGIYFNASGGFIVANKYAGKIKMNRLFKKTAN